MFHSLKTTREEQTIRQDVLSCITIESDFEAHVFVTSYLPVVSGSILVHLDSHRELRKVKLLKADLRKSGCDELVALSQALDGNFDVLVKGHPEFGQFVRGTISWKCTSGNEEAYGFECLTIVQF